MFTFVGHIPVIKTKNFAVNLAVKGIDSGTRFGFGVDETTALIVAEADGSVNLRAMGAGSVWIFDAKGVKDAAALAKQARLLKAGEVISWPN